MNELPFDSLHEECGVFGANPILNDKHRFLVTIPNSIEGNTKA